MRPARGSGPDAAQEDAPGLEVPGPARPGTSGGRSAGRSALTRLQHRLACFQQRLEPAQDQAPATGDLLEGPVLGLEAVVDDCQLADSAFGGFDLPGDAA